MFFESKLTGTFRFLHLVLTLLVGLAPVALVIAVKVALYRRRIAEDKAVATTRPEKAAPTERMESDEVVPRSTAGKRRTRLVRPLPKSFQPHRPLALFVERPNRAPAPLHRGGEIAS
ncbi:MAG: hypothetical protein ABJF10_16100 [Chthoniobacter sp.]|uniref:hypothetical protein n=1 Tax=Chthoniobacter sp. TaxID=2510640 RepID=UPI0032AB9620